MDLADMGRALRALRRSRGLTRAALGEAAGARAVLVGRWERGEAAPSREQAAAAAELLGLDPIQAEAWAASAPPLRGSGGLGPSPARRRRWPRRRRGRGAAAGEDPGPTGMRSFGAPAQRQVLTAPAAPRPPSYLDDPGERRRYLMRAALTILILGLLAVLAVWALAELAGTWGPFLDMFRGAGATGTPGAPLALAGGC